MQFVTSRQIILNNAVLLIKVCFHMWQIDRLSEAQQNGLNDLINSALLAGCLLAQLRVNIR